MNDSNELNSTQNNQQTDNKSEKKPNELVLGLRTFVAFVIFMAVWMYFST